MLLIVGLFGGFLAARTLKAEFVMQGEVVDFGENKGKDEAAKDIDEPMHVREETPGTDKTDENKDEDFDDDAGGLGFDILGEVHQGEEENGGHNHDMSRGERRVAGAVGAGVEDD